MALSISLSQGLVGLLQLRHLSLVGFTGVEDLAFTLASLPSLETLGLENCESLNSLFGSTATVANLCLTASAPDRPIDTILTEDQWLALESLSIEVVRFPDVFDEPGSFPKQLLASFEVSLL